MKWYYVVMSHNDSIWTPDKVFDNREAAINWMIQESANRPNTSWRIDEVYTPSEYDADARSGF